MATIYPTEDRSAVRARTKMRRAGGSKPPDPAQRMNALLEGEAERDRNDLDVLLVDRALLGEDVVDATLDESVELAEVQRNARAPVDPELGLRERRRRDAIGLGLHAVGADSRDDVRAYR